MYIKTYENETLSSPFVSPRKFETHENLANSTPEGLNLHKLMLRKSLSKNERSPAKPQLIQQVKILPGFYKSNCFGTTLKNNRIRELKSKKKVKDRVPEKVKEELMNIIQQNVLRYAKNRSISQRKTKNKKHLELHFTVAGRPMSRDQKMYDNIASPENINKLNQTVLDFTKLNSHNFRVSEERSHRLNQNFIDFSRRSRKEKPTMDEINEGEPQLLIDYRRSMSSGRKRLKSNQYMNMNMTSGRGKIEDLSLLGGEKLNPWAVRKFQQDQQLLF